MRSGLVAISILILIFSIIYFVPFRQEPPIIDPPPVTGPPADVQILVAGDRKVLTIAGVVYAFRWCPPSTFTMGSPYSEKDRNRDELLHEVTLTKGFWMLETEVAQEMWESVMGNNPSKFKGDKRHPVKQVNWNDCQEFIKKLNNLFSPSTLGAGLGGFKFRLPTEAQWEYACRAGTTTPFHFGSEGKANFYRLLRQTSVVGSYPANAWGLHDMHGNVREWCSDWYGNYPSGAVTDPVGPSTGSYRVLRGGGWDNNAKDGRSASRYRDRPSHRSNNPVLRLFLNIDQSNDIGIRLSLVSENE